MRRSTGCPRLTARRSAAPSSWRDRAATPPPRCSRCCRCGAHRRRRGGHQGRGLGRRARGHGETHFVSVVDNVNAYKVDGHRHTAELEQELPDVRFSFVTHLLPIDQGILASCYSNPESRSRAAEARALFEWAYADEPFVHVVDDSPRTRDVRDTNRARVHVTVVDRRVISLCAIDNLWKGAAGQAVQDLNLMLGLPGDRGSMGARVTAASKRLDARAGSTAPWVDAPVREAGTTELPAGFRAAGVAAASSRGPRRRGARLGRRGHRLGRPLHHQRAGGGAGDRLEAGPTSAACGRRGQFGLLERRRRPARPRHRRGDAGGRRRPSSGLEPAQVGVASTGVIGIELPRERGAGRRRAACDGSPRRGRGLLRGDPDERQRPQAGLSRGAPSPAAGCAGRPGQGRRDDLAPLRHDVLLHPDRRRGGSETLDLLTGVCVKRSFDRISVDGQLSTSDTVVALASGASGVRVEPETQDELRLGEALDALMRQLGAGDRRRRRGRPTRRPDCGARAPRRRSSRWPARSPTRRS